MVEVAKWVAAPDCGSGVLIGFAGSIPVLHPKKRKVNIMFCIIGIFIFLILTIAFITLTDGDWKRNEVSLLTFSIWTIALCGVWFIASTVMVNNFVQFL